MAKPNWDAKVGGVISGNLGRGAGGRFTNVAQGTVSAVSNQVDKLSTRFGRPSNPRIGRIGPIQSQQMSRVQAAFGSYDAVGANVRRGERSSMATVGQTDQLRPAVQGPRIGPSIDVQAVARQAQQRTQDRTARRQALRNQGADMARRAVEEAIRNLKR